MLMTHSGHHADDQKPDKEAFPVPYNPLRGTASNKQRAPKMGALINQCSNVAEGAPRYSNLLLVKDRNGVDWPPVRVDAGRGNGRRLAILGQYVGNSPD